MKKSSKSSGTSARRSANARRKQASNKPVTIDLKAEEVKPAKATGTKTSVPKNAAKADTASSTKTTAKVAASKSEDLKKSSTTEKATPFGRTPGKDAPKPGTKPAEPAVAKAESAKPSSSGLGSKLAAAVVGGVVALGGAGALQYMGVLSTPGNSTDGLVATTTLDETRTTLQTRIDALEASLKKADDSATSTPAITMDAVDARIAELTAAQQPQAPENSATKEEVASLSDNLSQTGQKIEGLQTEIATIKETVTGLQTAVSTGEAGEGAGLAAITDQIENVSATVSELGTKVEDLATKTTEIAGRAAPEIPDNAATLAAVAALQAAIPATKTEISDQITQLKSQVDGVAEKAGAIDTLGEQLTGLKGAVDGLSLQATNNEAIVAALKEKVDNGVDKQAARAVAAAALKSDIDRGLPFEASLNTMQALAGETEELSKLATFAGKGVPTASALAKQFETVGGAVLKALVPPPSDDFASKLLAGAKSLVKVEPLTPQKGDAPTALVSQIGSAAAAGNLEQASKLWNTLPEAGQRASADWHTGVEARLSADALVSATVQSFLMSKAKP